MSNAERVVKSRNIRPPLKLVKTISLSREDWLEVRKSGIGSSDAAASVGLSPYQSMLELWLVKTGRDAGLPKIDPNDESSPMYWGTLLEPIVAAHYTKRTGNRVRKINAVLQHPDPDKHWMLANIDREVVGDSTVQILECKTAGEFGSRLWCDGVPEYVQLQVQHQLAVTGKAAADVCVLICGQEIRVYRVDRDESLIARLRMGDASKAIFETGSVSFKRSKDGTGIDMVKMLQDQPDLNQRYSLTKPGTRRFLITT